MYFIEERIKKILNEFKKYEYSSNVKIGNFFMKEGSFSSIEDAENCNQDWMSFGSEDKWGGRDSHCWFRTRVSVPKSFSGKCLAINLYTVKEGWDATNPQFILYIDGKIIQGIDVNHREVIISDNAEANKVYQIDLHAYGGMIHDKSYLFAELVTLERNVRELYYNIQVPLWVIEKLQKEDKK
jgi:alpha-mannosidase